MYAITATCPYCGEPFEVPADPSEGLKQEFVQDCDVCCRPIRVRLIFRRGGRVELDARREDEGV